MRQAGSAMMDALQHIGTLLAVRCWHVSTMKCCTNGESANHDTLSGKKEIGTTPDPDALPLGLCCPVVQREREKIDLSIQPALAIEAGGSKWSHMLAKWRTALNRSLCGRLERSVSSLLGHMGLQGQIEMKG